jgi:threonine dehydrogenase-like Zn-dependent dehydrogenase
LRIEARVAWLTAPRQLEWRREQLDTGALAPGQLLCETLVSAISPGTELAAYTGQPPLRDGPGYPRLLGYCNVARVLAVGAGVPPVRPGQRVLTFASHRSHFLAKADEVLLVLDEQARAADLACAYLFHLGLNAVLRSQVRAGSRVLVIGLGVLGLTSVAMAALAGARVSALSDHAGSRRLAREQGAGTAVERSELPALEEALTPSRADVVILTSNSWEDFALALRLAGQRATIACLGFPGRTAAPGAFNPLDSRYFYARQLRIEAVGLSPERADARGFARYNERDNLAYIAALIGSGRLRPAALVSGSYPAADLARAYQDLLAGERSAPTCLLDWSGP